MSNHTPDRHVDGDAPSPVDWSATPEQVRSSIEQFPHPVVLVTPDWRISFANAAAIAQSGVPTHVLTRDTIWEIYPELATEAFRPAHERAMHERESANVRAFSDHYQAWFEITVHPIDGGIASYLRDVTRDQLTRLKLEESIRSLREQAALLDATRDAMIVRDLDHTIRYWNSGASAMYGWSADEAVGRSARDMLYHDVREFDSSCTAVLRDGYWSGEIRERAQDNRLIVGDGRWHLLRDDEGDPIGIFTVTSDITDFRRVEDMRERAQRMESLGTLAGGIAHDLNNVLTPLLLATQVLLADDRSDRDREMLTTIEKSARRGATMIRQMLTFARGVDVERAPIDLADLLAEAHRFARDTLPDSVDILVRHEARHGTLGSTTHLMQVVQNLILNARDAMPDGGTLTLATHSGSPHEPPEHDPLPHAVLEKDHVALSIIDSGVGMTPEIVERLWEPFFTTKPLGEGTGLGLPTSAAIIESHDGRISVRTEPGRGTRFDIVLPAAELAPASAERDDDAVPGHGETILVVDDEPLILATTAEALQAHDYRVLTTNDGHEALRILRDDGHRIDLVLTDMMMPGFDGASLAAHIAASPHDIPVLAASGLAAGAELMPSATSGITAFLAKPYTVPTLLGAVRLALHGTA